MDYSKIRKLRIKNYNAIKDITLDFEDEHPIIYLKSDNGIGKTSIINALTALAVNDAKLKSHIRYGEKELEIDVMLDDKTILQKKKGTKNKVRVIGSDGKDIINIDKIDAGGEVKEITDRMGFLQDKETNYVLNVRSYLDPMLFVNTKTSDNYKIFYNALKINDLLNGIKVGGDDINTQKKSINEKLIQKKTYLEIRDNIKIIDDTSAIEQCLEKLKRMEKMENLLLIIKNKIKIQKNSEIKEIPKVIYGIPLEKCKTLVDKINGYKTINEKIAKMPKIINIEKVLELSKRTNVLREEITQIKEKIKQIKIICPHCGKDIVG